MQALLQEPTPPFPKPNCLVWYAGDPCDVLIQRYNQAAEQRQLLDWRLSVTLPLQRQIADQKQQIADQQSQIRTLQAKGESLRMQEQTELSSRTDHEIEVAIALQVRDATGDFDELEIERLRSLTRGVALSRRPLGLSGKDDTALQSRCSE